MKLLKGIVIFAGIVAFFSIMAMWTDISKVNSDNEPMFSFETATYENGDVVEYTGLFYKIFNYKNLSGNSKVKYGTWLMNYENN